MSLAHYDDLVEEFNQEHGTSYHLANKDQLEASGTTFEEHVEYITSMDDEDFFNYLNDIHENYVDASNTESTLTEQQFAPYTTPATTEQRCYYGMYSQNYLYMVATWVSVNGQNHYSTVQSFGSATDWEHFPVVYPTSASYNFINLNQQVEITYTYDVYIAKGMIDLVYHSPMTIVFTANGGDIHIPVDL